MNTVTDISEPRAEDTDTIDYGMEYVHDALMKAPEDSGDLMRFVAHYLFVQLEAQRTTPEMHKQMNSRARVKMFGKKAVEALAKEMLQFIDLDVFEGIMADTLTPKQKKDTLLALGLIKLKRNLILRVGSSPMAGRGNYVIYLS